MAHFDHQGITDMPNQRPFLTILLYHLIIVWPLSRTDVAISPLHCQGLASHMAPSSSTSFAATPTTGRHAAPLGCPTACMGRLNKRNIWIRLASLSHLLWFQVYPGTWTSPSSRGCDVSIHCTLSRSICILYGSQLCERSSSMARNTWPWMVHQWEEGRPSVQGHMEPSSTHC